jgi:5-methylcytosine-specific restriction endonuclease McrA
MGQREHLQNHSQMGAYTMAKKETRTYQDRREYLIKAVTIRRKKIREMAIAYKGGQCAACGYKRCFEALEFHHLDPTQKDFTISDRGYSQSWEKIKAELDKCVMLCANCHREAHAGLLGLSSVVLVCA